MEINEIAAKITSNLNKQEMLDFLFSLIETETVNPPGDEYLLHDIIMKSMKEIGAEVQIISKDEKRPNYIGRIGSGEPSVAIISHMDVVPPGEGWTHHPFQPYENEGKIYGRGALDNKGCLAASWAGIKALLKSGLKFKGTIYFCAVSDEEMGSDYGVEYIVEKGFKPDYAIVPDSGSIDKAIIGEKGAAWFDLESFGKQSHGSTPELGINAIIKVSKLISNFEKFVFNLKYDPRFTPPTINVGMISGGNAPNIVASRCKVTLDIRYPVGITEGMILKRMSDEIDVLKKEDKEVDIRLGEVTTRHYPHIIENNSKLIDAFKNTAKEIGMPMEFETSAGITVAKILNLNGIPAIAHSPDSDKTWHISDEYVKIENLEKCAVLWASVIYDLVR
ncbi:MAG TPA: M20 family metallopeptidase [Methanofastidiosum sp.]|jgi:succinyl-diaminopimelate desuccinylase|nr:M20 family metallopeptidase [Methanofastidiosum sp.]HNU61045.1 M20 family metallopeptidase [Methanofastidiosum sp.]HOI77197.1 M20 family metallopeptidase [Methanofastidiosum sp.]